MKAAKQYFHVVLVVVPILRNEICDFLPNVNLGTLENERVKKEDIENTTESVQSCN